MKKLFFFAAAIIMLGACASTSNSPPQHDPAALSAYFTHVQDSLKATQSTNN
jgi:uncharacterized lipoprotein YajG